MSIIQCIRQGIDDAVLPLDIEAMTVTAVLRWLPNRRLVVEGIWNGRLVVGKLFLPGRKGRAALRQEQRGLQAMASRQVLSPSVLDVRTLEDGAQLLIMEKLVGETALSYCNVDDCQLTEDRIYGLVRWVRDAQQRGVVQTDIHLGNFFRTPEGWALLDAAECRFGVPSRQRALANLASLVAQFPPLDVPDLTDCFVGLEDYRPVLAKMRSRRYRMILKKALRPCTEFAAVKHGNIQGMCRREMLEQVDGFLKRGLDDVMQTSNSLKLGGASTVIRDGQTGWVVKRYNIKSLFHWFKRQWGPTRAENAWLSGVFLREIGVQTPLPVAYFEEKRGGFTSRAWIVNEYQQGVGLDELPVDAPAPESVTRPVANFFLLMSRLGFRHSDMKASNLLVTPDSVSIIDLDAFSAFVRYPEAGYRKDYSRLMSNWPEGSALRVSIEQALAVSNDNHEK